MTLLRDALKPVTASMGLAAPFGWPGGKKLLKHRILALIPPHKTYVEPFAGAASVFWAKEPSAVEVLNDIDSDLMRFYQNIGDIQHCDTGKLAKDWDSLQAHRGQWEPCEFLSAVNCSFGTETKTKGSRDWLATPQGGVCTHDAPNFHKALLEYQARLAQTKLHNGDWEPVVHRYDAPDTFFYLDPPYHGTSRPYAGSKEDVLLRLARRLPTLKGKWLLSYDDHPEVKAAFQTFYILPVRAAYTLAAGNNVKQGRQLLIANYSISRAKMGQEADANMALREEGTMRPTRFQAMSIPRGKSSSPQMIAWQYKVLIAELQLLTLHASDYTCPCGLADIGEFCHAKHLLSISALAWETASITADPAHHDLLVKLGDEANDLHMDMRTFVQSPADAKSDVNLVEWSRNWRKQLETLYYGKEMRKAEVRELASMGNFTLGLEQVVGSTISGLGWALGVALAGFVIASLKRKEQQEEERPSTFSTDDLLPKLDELLKRIGV